jgi:hypothetical protein
MMTPKMSLRRNNIVKAYAHIIDALYVGEQGISVPAQMTNLQ